MEGSAKNKDEIAADAAQKKEKYADERKQVLQKVNQALLKDQKDKAAEIELDNVLRAAALAQEKPDKSVVVLIVQEIIISIDIGQKENDKINTSVFKQGLVVANRGKQVTETVMGKHVSHLTYDFSLTRRSVRSEDTDCHRNRERLRAHRHCDKARGKRNTCDKDC